MQTKILEVRDEATFIPVLCIDMNPGMFNESSDTVEAYDTRQWYLRRCGYPCEGRPNIAITNLNADGGPFTNDPYWWSEHGRTMRIAHHYILENWNKLVDGDVIDVQFILGETTECKTSERLL